MSRDSEAMNDRTCPVCGLARDRAAVQCARCDWDFSPMLGTAEETRAYLEKRLDEARSAWRQQRYRPDRVPKLGVPGTRAWPGAQPAAPPAAGADPQPTRPFPGPDSAPQPGPGDAPLLEANLQPGTFVGERYRVERNLSLGGGESEIYLCLDEHLPTDHPEARIVLKLYKTRLAPKQEVLDAIRNLSHPDLIRVLDFGTWNGRFFEVLEYCRGGSMADAMPYTPDGLLSALDEIVNGLDYCHQLGIVHRDIKPTNLLYRDEARTDLVITDFGISSYLRKWQEGGAARTRTSTAGRHTLDYAAPELFGEDEVSPKTDYYALGITLIHLISGRSPFEGLRDEQVYHAHVSNKIPQPAGLDERFAQLLCGLTQRRPENRWGRAQFMQWRANAQVTNDQGRPWQHQAFVDRPFPYCPKAANPTELAACLEEFDAARRLADQSIRHWVAGFDPPLADRIAALDKTVEKNPALAVKTLGWLLDRDRPLTLAPDGSASLQTLDDLIQVLRAPPVALKRFWQDGSLVAWIESRAFHDGQPDESLMARILDLAKRLSVNAELGLFALLHTLDPSRPLELVPGVLVETPARLEAVIAANLERRQALMDALTAGVASGRLAEWVRAVGFDGWESFVRRLAALPKAIAGIDQLPGYAVRWFMSPRAPFPTGGAEAAQPQALAAWMDASPEHRRRGVELLESGWLGLWLASLGRIDKPQALDALKSAQCSDRAREEMLLHLLDPGRPPTQVQVEPNDIRIDRLAVGATAARTFTLKSKGKGHVWGTCVLEGDTLGMRLEPLSFDGTPAEFRLSVDAAGLAAYSTGRASIAIDCSDGRGQHLLRVPVSYRVYVPVAGKIARSLLAGLVAGFLMFALRLWGGAVPSGYGEPNRALDWVSIDVVTKTFDRSFESFMGLLFPAIGLLGALVGLVFYLVRICHR